MNRREYYKLLQNPKWKIKASFIRKRDNHMCRICGKKSHRLQVHHTIYIKGYMPWDYDNETLISLCSTCHKKEHGIKNKKKKVDKPKIEKKTKKPKRTIKIMNHKELKDNYNQEVVKWLVSNNKTNVSEHVIDIIVSTLLTRDHVLTGGGFVQSVVNNDLRGAINNADDEVQQNLILIFRAFQNIDTYHIDTSI